MLSIDLGPQCGRRPAFAGLGPTALAKSQLEMRSHLQSPTNRNRLGPPLCGAFNLPPSHGDYFQHRPQIQRRIPEAMDGWNFSVSFEGKSCKKGSQCRGQGPPELTLNLKCTKEHNRLPLPHRPPVSAGLCVHSCCLSESDSEPDLEPILELRTGNWVLGTGNCELQRSSVSTHPQSPSQPRAVNSIWRAPSLENAELHFRPATADCRWNLWSPDSTPRPR